MAFESRAGKAVFSQRKPTHFDTAGLIRVNILLSIGFIRESSFR
jgi:hypothetical protein